MKEIKLFSNNYSIDLVMEETYIVFRFPFLYHGEPTHKVLSYILIPIS